jgi:nucleotidyltransferase substrate binding protein (TIGR01987 family)
VDRLNERLSVARQALRTLQEVLAETKTRIVRDATIQRFEYTFEAVWKAAQEYLQTEEGLDTGSPKSAIRDSFQVGLLSEAQVRTALRMADDRNLTVHTYDEALAEATYSRIEEYAVLMSSWLGAMEGRVGGEEK